MDDAFIELLTLETTVPLVVQLFGPRIQCITSHLIYKFPNGQGTPSTLRQPDWHRDVAYTPNDLGHARIPRMEMKIAYYLTDTTAPNSAVTLFARGSNHLKEPLKILPGQADPEHVVEPRLRPGDAVFFENRTYHAGAPNLTDSITKAVMFGYGFWWMKPMDYMVQPDALIAKVDDIGKQLLNGLRGPDGRFVPGGIHKPLEEWCKQHDVTYQPVDF
jgi:ectoine hydroxylase-related dioxygenase (phytanoyl-CoA dioxygenase family)